jgi:hypothetical protein
MPTTTAHQGLLKVLKAATLGSTDLAKNTFSSIWIFPTYIRAKEQGRKLPPLLLSCAIRRTAGNQRKDMRYQEDYGQPKEGPRAST